MFLNKENSHLFIDPSLSLSVSSSMLLTFCLGLVESSRPILGVGFHGSNIESGNLEKTSKVLNKL